MKYIIMCGGKYSTKTNPSLLKVHGETLVERTIRLLRDNGVNDIAISSNSDSFNEFGVEVLHHENYDLDDERFRWLYAFYPMGLPVCYLYGDVVYSPDAIHTIVNKEVDDIEFFASAKPFDSQYKKSFEEPFAFKVVDTKRFFDCVQKTLDYEDEQCFGRVAISWELWQVIKKTPLNIIKYNYTAINDYTCDVDSEADIKYFEKLLEGKI